MGDDELLERFAHLHHAVLERDALERRWRRDHDDVQARVLSLMACERVVARRAALYRCLIRHGWTPPPTVVRHLLEDEVLLAEPVGDVGG